MSTLMLDDIQQQFWSGLTSKDASIHAWINTSSSFSQSERMEVYRTTTRSLHVSAIGDDFPVCKKILGDDYFNLIAKKYFLAHPSTSIDLNDYGDEFAAFIENLLIERPELKEYSYLADLAKLEIAVKKAHFAKDEKELSIDGCEFDENSILSIRPDVIIQRSPYPVHIIWQMHQDECESIDIGDTKDMYLLCVFRQNFDVYVCELDDHVFVLLENISTGYSLGDIISEAGNPMHTNRALKYVLLKNWLNI